MQHSYFLFCKKGSKKEKIEIFVSIHLQLIHHQKVQIVFSRTYIPKNIMTKSSLKKRSKLTNNVDIKHEKKKYLKFRIFLIIKNFITKYIIKYLTWNCFNGYSVILRRIFSKICKFIKNPEIIEKIKNKIISLSKKVNFIEKIFSP